jgi:hypothetical protein
MPWRHMGDWKYITILDLGTRCRWVVSLTFRPLYCRWNRPRYTMDRRLVGPECRYGRYGEDKSLAPARNQTLVLQPVTIPTELFRSCETMFILRGQEIFILSKAHVLCLSAVGLWRGKFRLGWAKYRAWIFVVRSIINSRMVLFSCPATHLLQL